MATYFRTKARFSEATDEGIVKLVTREFLIEAESWTEAEARTYKLLETIVKGDFQIKKVNDSTIENVIIDDEDQDLFWLVKVKYPSIDDNGKEKYFTTQIVVTAKDILNAIQITGEALGNHSVADFEVISATLTKISEFYSYEQDSEEIQDLDEEIDLPL